MNDIGTVHLHRSNAPAGGRMRSCRLGRKSLLLAPCITAAVLAVGMWRSAIATLPATWVARGVVVGALGIASNARSEPPSIVQAAAGTSPAAPPAALSGSTATAVPPALAQQLSDLKAAYDHLAQRALDTDQRLERVESDVARLRQLLARYEAAAARARKHAGSTVGLPRVAQATPGPGAQQRPQVLGVDTWNGQPSVSVAIGSAVRFYSEGDVVADALLRRADPASQRVEFVTASEVFTTIAAAGEAR
jgi:hypothetical protein